MRSVPDPLSRRTLMRTSLIAPTAGILGACGEDASAQDQGLDAPVVVSVTAFGARGDGRTDDRAAIQAAVDQVHRRGGGAVVIPGVDVDGGRCFRVSLPIVLRSGVTLKGEGRRSLLFNDRRISRAAGDQLVVLPGNYHPAYAQRLRFYDCAPAPAGTREIRPRRAEAAALFAPGTTVILRDGRWTPSFDGFQDRLWTRVNEVVGLDAERGRIRLRHPVDGEADGVIQIADANPTDIRYSRRARELESEPLFIAKRAGMQDLALRSHGPVMADSATFECRFERLLILAERGVFGNLFCHTTFDRITCEVTTQVLEASQNSHDSSFTNINGRVTRWSGADFQLVTFNEGATRLTLDGFRIEGGGWAGSAPALRFGPGSSGCAIRNGSVSVPNGRGAILAMEVGRDPPGAGQRVTRDCRFEAIRCTGGTAGTNAIFCATAEPRLLRDCAFVNLRFDGNYLRAGRVDGIGTVVERCIWSKRDAPLQVMAGASGCRIADNSIPGGLDLMRQDLRGLNRIERNRSG
jgi:hypothetical protein